MLNAITLGIAEPTFNAVIIANTRPNAANGTAKVAKANAPIAASLASFPIIANGYNNPVITAHKILKAIAFGIAFLTFKALIIANTKPNAAITPDNANKAKVPSMAAFLCLPNGIKSAMTPVKTTSKEPRAMVDVITDSGFKHDSVIRIPPKIAIIPAKAKSEPITFAFTRLVTAIKPAISTDNTVIAISPCLRLSSGTNPSNTAIKANIPIAPAIAIIVLPITAA